jgi:hypothetical protein
MTISAAAMDAVGHLPAAEQYAAARWFSCGGCVVTVSGCKNVFIRGTLIGSFEPDERAVRNAILMGLAADPRMHLGELAAAFEISSDAVRRMRRVYERDGLEPLLTRAPGGSESKVGAALRRRMEKLFENGASISDAYAAAGRKAGVGRATVGRIRLAWAARKQSIEQEQAHAAPTRQLALVPRPGPEANTQPVSADTNEGDGELRAIPSVPKGDGVEERVEGLAPVGARFVQHLGTWLLVAVVQRLGLYERAASAAANRVGWSALRLGLDAVVMALAIGEKSVEGVRRLATSSASALMLASSAPSPTWTRRTLGRFSAEGGGAVLHLSMARGYVEGAREQASTAGPVFYVDNHLRPYTGKHVIRRGWRMQDKRVRPGTTDYYVHDEDGRPVGRVAAPSHDSLTSWLSPIARLLRLALGEEETILLAFDRAGAFPHQMAELRDEGFEFVTYERKPYPELPLGDFTEEVVIDGERLLLSDSRRNLGAGRGRLRRIAVRMPDGHQVNLLAASRRTAKQLVEVMRGRWRQENGFKHGVERWGMNQLDGRQVVAYPPDTVVPNPARRRLDRALRIARVREGIARSELARLAEGDPRRAHFEREVNEAMAEQKQLEALRPSTPERAALKDTELAGKLVHHTVEYKMTLDTIRIACANAESELAAELALSLPKAAEAKKTLANLFAAPGNIRVGKRTIGVCLQPAGTRREQKAFAALLKEVNRWGLTVPGDQQARRLKLTTARIS